MAKNQNILWRYGTDKMLVIIALIFTGMTFESHLEANEYAFMAILFVSIVSGIVLLDYFYLKDKKALPWAYATFGVLYPL